MIYIMSKVIKVVTLVKLLFNFIVLEEYATWRDA